MKKLTLTTMLAFLIQGFCFAQTFQTNSLTGNISSFNLQNRTNVEMVMQITWPLNRTINGTFISNDPIISNSDTNGNFAFTNVQWGKYLLRPKDSTGSYWIPQVGTNVTGTWTLASLCQTSSAMPPNPSTNYYTMAQVDALISGIQTASGSPLTNTVWGIEAGLEDSTNKMQIHYVFTNGVPWYGVITTNQ